MTSHVNLRGAAAVLRGKNFKLAYLMGQYGDHVTRTSQILLGACLTSSVVTASAAILVQPLL
jgi:hypothetical protein